LSHPIQLGSALKRGLHPPEECPPSAGKGTSACPRAAQPVRFIEQVLHPEAELESLMLPGQARVDQRRSWKNSRIAEVGEGEAAIPQAKIYVAR
jgi:hypothetical protein